MKNALFSTIICAAALVATSLAAGASQRLEDGKRSYERLCAPCHTTGAEGAPKIGEAQDWALRSKLWEAVLLEHAEKGYLKMPARGSAEHATDYDVSTAAEYMLTLTHPELPAD